MEDIKSPEAVASPSQTPLADSVELNNARKRAADAKDTFERKQQELQAELAKNTAYLQGKLDTYKEMWDQAQAEVDRLSVPKESVAGAGPVSPDPVSVSPSP